MAVDLILSPEAEQDIDEAYVWYERQRAGLGEDFPGELGCLHSGNPALAEDARLYF